ncbi:MAG: cupredoxin domain-containing protein [Parcubacteria group bacterium]|nr:cupredoxin domain-containing protein [Parcubacteria group bacterium]
MNRTIIIGILVIVAAIAGILLIRSGSAPTLYPTPSASNTQSAPPESSPLSSPTAGVSPTSVTSPTSTATPSHVASPTPTPVPRVKEFDIVAKRFEFTPSTIAVQKGDRVRLRIVSTDVTHGFSVPDLGIEKTLPPNQVTSVEFTATERGVFSFQCSVFCGAGHSHMTGQIIVR